MPGCTLARCTGTGPLVVPPLRDDRATGRGPCRPALGVVATILFLTGCAARATSVSPSEIPALNERVAANPSDGEALLRLSAALFADGRCEEAIPVARRGEALRPADPVGPLVVGQCLEREARYDDALSEYGSYLARSGSTDGATVVRARQRIARRGQATAQARQALANEATLGDVSSATPAVAVLPSVVSGDEEYASLSVGLAALMASDLQSLGRFRIVERMQVDALLAEMRLGEAGRLDPATSARVGRLVRANRMVQGLADIPDEDAVRLEAAVVQADGAVRGPDAESGRLADLLRMQKQVVIGVAEELGPPLTPAERTRLLDNGTQNVIAFLAYSRGLDAESRGDYTAATSYFADAVRADPGFTEARQAESDAAADAVVAAAPPEGVTTVAGDVSQAVTSTQDGGPMGTALTNAVTDVASTQSERVTDGAGGPTSSQQINQLTNTPSTGATPGVVPLQVLIRIPIPIPVR